MVTSMQRLRAAMSSRRVRLVGLSVAALTAAGFASSSRADNDASTKGGCAHAAPVAAAPVRTLMSAASDRSGFQRYDDMTLDVRTAPDICAEDVVTNDNRSISAGIHIHDRDGFFPGDRYSVFFDTDSNAATGGSASGVSVGAEYAIDISAGGAVLRAWTGSSFDAATPRSPLLSQWLWGFGPIFRVGLADLGSPERFGFVFVTSNGDDFDLAPDSGTWSYRVRPLQLRAGPVSVGTATAGMAFVARMEVVRSDFDAPLTEGAIRCAAKLGSTSLAGRGSFRGGRVACAWRLPRNARGKQLRGRITIRFQGVEASRAFHVSVS